MACCGRSKNKTPVNNGRSASPPTIPPNPTPVEPRKTAPPAVRQIPAKPAPQSLNKTIDPKPVPKAITTDEIPPCRYREFKSQQIIGGRPVETYWCKAFSMNVRKEHCKVCQKNDK